MNRLRYLGLLGLVSALAVSHAPAQTTAPAAAVVDNDQFTFPSDKLDDMKDAYLKANQLKEGDNDDGSWVAYAWQQVDAVPGPRWGPARINALNIAEEKSREMLAMHFGADVASKTVTTLFNNSGEFLNPPEAGGEVSRFQRIKEKIMQAAEGELDDALRKIGTSEGDIKAMTAPAKRIALKTEIVREVTSRGFAAISGFRVIQSFEGHVGDHYAVAVLARYSEKNKQIAQLIHEGGGVFISSGKGKPLDDWLPKNKEQSLMDYGIRVFPDENGQPIVVAFSQAAVSVPAGASMEWQQAQAGAADDIAENEARGMISDFAAGTTSAETASKRGESVVKGVSTDKDVDSFFEDPTKFVQSINKVIKTESTAFQQVGSVHQHLHLKHPETGALFSEVVYVWTPAAAESVARMRAGKSTVEQPEDKTVGGRKGNDYPVKDW